jgi:hypothetical protein
MVMMRQEETKAIRVVMKINVKGKKERGRPKKKWLDTIENDMRAVSLCIEDIENHDK